MNERAPHFLRFARALTHVSPRAIVPIVTLSSLIAGCGSSDSTEPGPPGLYADTSTTEGGGGVSADVGSDAKLVDAGISTPPDADDAGASDASDAAQDGETIPPGGPMAPPELPVGFLV